MVINIKASILLGYVLVSILIFTLSCLGIITPNQQFLVIGSCLLTFTTIVSSPHGECSLSGLFYSNFLSISDAVFLLIGLLLWGAVLCLYFSKGKRMVLALIILYFLGSFYNCLFYNLSSI